MCGFFLANFPCWIDFYPLQCDLFSLFGKKTTQKFADYKFSCTFATAIENETIGRLAQLVQSICLTSRGSAVRIRQRPLNEFLVNHCFFFLGRLAQLVQSICLTSRGSAVRIRQRPPPKRKIIRAFSSAGSEHLPYKQRVGGSNPSTPTPKYNCQLSPIGRLAQLVQSICLTSRGSAVRIRQRPLQASQFCGAFFFLISFLYANINSGR